MWLDENLDWDRFEYTFIGNVSEKLTRIRHVPPVPSSHLAQMLKEHDIYITASKNDPCSNALIEGLSCGLPALYLDSGGHAELVGYGGLPFQSNEELLSQLETLVEHYEMFQNLISVPSLDSVAEKYLAIAREAAQ
jgi:glycosyltransferase involved in cell wall biosynthesis